MPRPSESNTKRHKTNRTMASGVETVDSDLRIIGGKWRGTRLAYHGDRVTRPMKHRVREAIFNLVGPAAEGKHALDLFAGTGALGLEAISRGATSGTFIERHIPTAKVVEQNIGAMGLCERTQLHITSAFLWVKRDLASGKVKLPDSPWLVFVSPPYDFFVDRAEEMLALISSVIDHAPTGSLVVVEADQRFDFDRLPGKVRQTRHDTGWDVRTYSPAVVGLWQCE